MARAPKTGHPKRREGDRKMRQVRFSPEKMQEICERLANGESWLQLCQEEGMPAYSTFYTWQRKRPEFATNVRAARTMAADGRADEALDVARASTPATVQSDKLLVGTLMAQAGRMAPRNWGTKADDVAASDEPKTRKIVLIVRNFVPVRLPDGRVITREIRPDGSYVDDV